MPKYKFIKPYTESIIAKDSADNYVDKQYTINYKIGDEINGDMVLTSNGPIIKTTLRGDFEEKTKNGSSL